MSDLLFDVNLQQLPDDFLTGTWRVSGRVLNRADPDSPLAQATHVELTPGALQVQVAEQLAAYGSWSVRRDELLQRPYLDIRMAEEHTRALITRLRRSADGLRSQLDLYFFSGMEVLLTQP